MKKIYNILNASIEVTAEEDVIKFVDNCVYELPLLDSSSYKYFVTYIKDPKEYMSLSNKLRKNNIIRFYGEEYKDRIVDKDTIYLIDDNSIIIHNGNRFVIVGNTDFSKNHVVYLIREAIYEGFILKNNLLIHSAAFAKNNDSSLLIGRPGAGKTTLLMELLMNTDYDYVSNDLVGIINNKAMASIIPVRIANGTMSRFDNKEYKNLEEKRTINLKDFLKEFNLDIKNNVLVRNIIFPKFNINGSFNINEMNYTESMKIIESQLMNFQDDVRPYLWVNEYDRRLVDREQLIVKLIHMLSNANIYEIEYGRSISKENIKEMKRVIES
ncbi:MAG: hypothetical protein IKR57_00565 [Bacilli bacterium]|nr:hypothetical protein [Bacilli bacterium]